MRNGSGIPTEYLRIELFEGLFGTEEILMHFDGRSWLRCRDPKYLAIMEEEKRKAGLNYDLTLLVPSRTDKNIKAAGFAERNPNEVIL